MGGTDSCDQQEAYYDDRQRSLRWQMRIILHFLRIAVNNARILYNSGLDENDKMNSLEFIQSVVLSWCNDGEEMLAENHEDLSQNDLISTKYWKRIRWESEFSFRTRGHHFPEEILRNEVHDKRGICRYCYKKTAIKCQRCNVFLCIKKENNEDCFAKFHTEREFEEIAES